MSILGNEDLTFRIKRDFEMRKFLIKCRPDYMFKTSHVGGESFEQINTNSNVVVQESNISQLIENGKTVVVLYDAELKMDCYNFKDGVSLLNTVVSC
ncbi:MAG: hypothetical protein ABF991_00245 [Liquorilactobacillus hordei]|uniref:hypothetical protein n=1 Tax=Liquorilactobacillus hordei TaxID=468911 RepID=UPI0039ED1953